LVKNFFFYGGLKKLKTYKTSNIASKYTPKISEGYEYALGEWVEATDDNGNSVVLSCPGLTGSWPFVDLCRNYACLFFIRKINDEQKKAFYLQLKKVVDRQFSPVCK
jgi:hypothetical protein